MMRERRIVAEAIEQRTQRADVVGGASGMSAPTFGAEAVEQRRVVIAPGARMDLQHQPVVEAHARHLGEHLAAEQIGVARVARRPSTMRANSASASAGLRSAVRAVGWP